MTISSEVRKAGPFAGNNVATNFPFAFKVFTPADLLVVRADPTGDETVLAMGSDYTVALNPNQNEAPGGSVTLNAPLATGYILAVTSQVGNLQPVDLTNQGGFYPNVINAALDRATIQIQQLAEEMSRAAKLPITRDEDVDELLNDLVRVADNMDDLNTVAGIAPEIQAVAAIDSEVVTVAGVASSIPPVAAIDSEVVTVAGVASGIPTVAASAANIAAVAADLANVDIVAGSISDVNATGSNIGAVVEVADHIDDIQAALADLPALAAKVSKTGDTMSGPLTATSETASGMATATGYLAAVTARGKDAGAAMIALHRPGVSGVYLGLDTDNQLAVGGWTMGAVRRRIYHEGSILGTVSFSGGIPTGAGFQIIGGVNNGGVRLADGTQICWYVLPVLNLATGTTGPGTWTYSAAFASPPACFFGWSGGYGSSIKSFAETISANQATYFSLNESGAARTGVVNGFAIGRWAI